jgi:hypothetical protein
MVITIPRINSAHGSFMNVYFIYEIWGSYNHLDEQSTEDEGTNSY